MDNLLWNLFLFYYLSITAHAGWKVTIIWRDNQLSWMAMFDESNHQFIRTYLPFIMVIIVLGFAWIVAPIWYFKKIMDR